MSPLAGQMQLKHHLTTTNEPSTPGDQVLELHNTIFYFILNKYYFPSNYNIFFISIGGLYLGFKNITLR